MDEKTTNIEGGEVTLHGTVLRVQEGHQHPDYAVVELDREVTISSPDGAGASGRVVQVALADLERENRG